MRIDHYAYQRGTQVAAVGFLLQFVIALTLLIFGWQGNDWPLLFTSLYVFQGLWVWLSLIVIFHQHKLERLEALEEDELAAARASSGSAFDTEPSELKVAARRLRLMHSWLMPIVSIVLAAILVALAWLVWVQLNAARSGLEGAPEIQLTTNLGLAVALCLAFAAVCFIFSRFVAGMAKQPAWQNLRGGAAYMVGTAIVLLAVAAGIIFRFFHNDNVIIGILWALPFYMAFVAVEIILNLILNIYRPRVAGETPRPAFDSRVLSLFAAPDSLVRTLNEAVNYQFGFDVTSSWGYQLLIRSFLWLIGFGLIVLVVLNMMVVVEPHQQAIKLSGGQIVEGEVHGPGLMWKLPWPFQTAEVFDVGRLRELRLTARVIDNRPARVWGDELKTEGVLDPFIVGSTRMRTDDEFRSRVRDLAAAEAARAETEAPPQPPADGAAPPEIVPEADLVTTAPAEDNFGIDEAIEEATNQFALVDAEIVLQYRIREDGLKDYLLFSTDEVARRQRLPMRDRALRLLALREVTQALSQMDLDDVLARARLDLVTQLRDTIQKSFDQHKTGVELVALNFPTLQPRGLAAAAFEEIPIAMQVKAQVVAQEEQAEAGGLAAVAGSLQNAERALEEIQKLRELENAAELDTSAIAAQEVEIQQMLVRGGGQASQIIAMAERDRWIKQMDAASNAVRLKGQLLAYNAAPQLYMQRELMLIYSKYLWNRRKIVLGVDPSRITLDVELKEINPGLGLNVTKPEATQGASQP